MKVKVWMLSLLAVMVIALTACGGNEPDQGAGEQPEGTDQGSETEENMTIRLGLVCGGMTPLLAQIGINDGSFEEAGLTVEEHCFTSGSDAVQALVGGSIDVNLGSYEHVLRFANNALSVKAYGQLYDGVGYSLIVREDAPYQGLEELAGETLAVTRAGSLSDTGLRYGLEASGLDPDRDVEIIGSGSGASMFASIENSQVAGGMVSEPTISQMVSSGDFRVLYEPEIEYAGIVVMATTEWVDENSEAMTVFLRVMNEINDRVTDDPASAVEPMQQNFENIEPDVLEMAIANQLARVPEGLRVTEEGAANVAETAVELEIIEEPVSFDEAVDLSYLP
ncbi:ABC transporter substrate-binding protein [Halalkalibacter oceani]|uniref:ABC transporter substrate-binding protein n=1 Tax=Halalkalibacter oceani TaxID=1653776 RepID=A0A9X2INY0_9BACI|nr:ABC transporter substrate-binding protein [Halalkalibacter oceani]MCM3714246.1 ABC transporter substrate-binding protein [Halalkalibacter oceani]